MRVQDRISRTLQAAFSPALLNVFDETSSHLGHVGWRATGETHFRVEIVSQAFCGKSHIERHRMIHAALANEIKGGIHALSIMARAPGE